MIKIVECPRDAMQGLKTFIPTEKKIKYIDQLLKVGFDTLDFGSFVSPRAVPQMADTEEVLANLDLSETKTKLLAIVANVRGAKDAAKHEGITYLGFPFSVSETFQKRNTNSTIEQSVDRVAEIQEICQRSGKQLVLYISMGFGNPYGDPYSPEIVLEWVDRLQKLDIRIFSLSDTVGVGDPETIKFLFDTLVPKFPDIEFGAHLHTAPHNWRVKIDAASAGGCKRFDTAINGFGGCPMAKDELIGNMTTEFLINLFETEEFGPNFNLNEFENALRVARNTFPLTDA